MTEHNDLLQKSQDRVELSAVGIETEAPEFGEPRVLVGVKRSLFPKRRKRKPQLGTLLKALTEAGMTADLGRGGTITRIRPIEASTGKSAPCGNGAGADEDPKAYWNEALKCK